MVEEVLDCNWIVTGWAQGLRYAIRNQKTGKWSLCEKALYDACRGIKKKLRPYKNQEELNRQF